MTDLTRRHFLTTAGVATLALSTSRLVQAGGSAAAPAATGAPAVVTTPAPVFPAPPLPYVETALEPVISAKTIGYHYYKHHLGALKALNDALLLPEFASYKDQPIEQIMLASANQKPLAKLFNSSASVISHEFYWASLKPKGGDKDKPSGKLSSLIEAGFGDYEKFKTKFVDVGMAHLGSGYVWLVENKGKLEIVSLNNLDNPKMFGMKPLLTVDIYEHAYYLDYQNLRKDYLVAVVEKLLNWPKAAERLSA
ncbi:MAG: superoxide dismutase [Methylococcaceae bacterium]|nr:superoxide dismutase [Methylococcaceae bacterium]